MLDLTCELSDDQDAWYDGRDTACSMSACPVLRRSTTYRHGAITDGSRTAWLLPCLLTQSESGRCPTFSVLYYPPSALIALVCELTGCTSESASQPLYIFIAQPIAQPHFFGVTCIRVCRVVPATTTSTRPHEPDPMNQTRRTILDEDCRQGTNRYALSIGTQIWDPEQGPERSPEQGPEWSPEQGPEQTPEWKN